MEDGELKMDDLEGSRMELCVIECELDGAEWRVC